jgi:hypothetical protein
MYSRVAGWLIFKPKIPNWVNDGMYILWPFGIFLLSFGNLVVIRYIFPVLDDKNLATLGGILSAMVTRGDKCKCSN